MREVVSAIVAVVVFAVTLQAQPSATRSAFDVAAIRLSSLDADAGRYMRMQNDHDFVARNYTVKDLVVAAYDLTPQLVSGGAKWFESERYEILAKAPGEVRPNQNEQMAMLRELLIDRFDLKFHRQNKTLPIYSLIVPKGGNKMTKSADSAEAPQPLVFAVSPQGAKLSGRNANMAEFASVIQRVVLDRPVVNQTGLSERYDFELDFMPDESQFGGQFQVRYPEATSDATKKIGLLTALQEQMGLRLLATRGPVSTLVVDSVQRPSEN